MSSEIEEKVESQFHLALRRIGASNRNVGKINFKIKLSTREPSPFHDITYVSITSTRLDDCDSGVIRALTTIFSAEKAVRGDSNYGEDELDVLNLLVLLRLCEEWACFMVSDFKEQELDRHGWRCFIFHTISHLASIALILPYQLQAARGDSQH